MAKLVPCKTCKHEVDQFAKLCPNCGAKNPGMSAGQSFLGCLGIIVLVFVIGFSMEACSGSDSQTYKPTIELEQAKDYQLLSTSDQSFPGRKRIQANISSPDASTEDELAQTAMKAAIDQQKSTRAHVVTVFLGSDLEQINTGDAYAIARYAPDNGGYSGDQGWRWQVEVALPLTRIEEKTYELWELHKDQFGTEGSWEVDIDSFNEFVSKELDIPKSDVSLRIPIRKPYEVEK